MCSLFLRRSILNLSILWLGTLFTVQLQSPTGRPIRHLHYMFFRMFDGQANAGNLDTACKSRGNLVVLLQ